jgi:hypothetical protein
VATMNSPISSLPPELLLDILHLAAGEPHAVLDTSPLGSSRSGEWRRSWAYPYTHGPNSRTSRMKTKTALVLVSKYWRIMSLEILFEWANLHNAALLNSFFSLVKNEWTKMQQENVDDGSNSASTGKHIGRFVKYLHVYLPGPEDHDHVHLEFTPDKLIPLFRFFTNLEWLSLYHGGSEAEFTDISIRMVAQVANNGCRLRSMAGMTDFALFPLLDTPQVDTIEVMNLSGSPDMGNFWDDIPPLTFPRLNTLDLSTWLPIASLFRWLSRCTLPSLIRFVSARIGSNWDDYASLFLAHGKSLVALDLSNPAEFPLSLLLTCCPSLEEATIHPDSFEELAPAIPKLAYIGIPFYLPPYFYTAKNRQRIRDWDGCMKLIFEHRNRGTLAVIRLPEFEPEQMSLLRNCGRSAVGKLEHWIEVCKAEGVRLEHEDGELVEITERVDDTSDIIEGGDLSDTLEESEDGED